MTGEEAGRPAEAEFLDFAQAREGLALRAATLVCADPLRAQAVVREALTTVAGDWATAREEGPEAALRAELYRRALDDADGTPAGSVHTAVPDVGGSAVAGGVDLLAEQRLATLAVLERLGPRDRALASLRWFEERSDRETAALLDLDAAGLHAAVDALRESLGAVVHGDAGVVAASDDELRGLLDLVTDEVPEPALAVAAWEAARARRRTVRRRGLLGAGVVLAGGAVAVSVLGGEDPPRRVRAPRRCPASPTAGSPGVSVAGATVLLAPDPRAEPLLPLYPDVGRPRPPATPRARPRPAPGDPLAGREHGVGPGRLPRPDRGGPRTSRPSSCRARRRASQLVAMAPLRGHGRRRRQPRPRARAADDRRRAAPARVRAAGGGRRPRGPQRPDPALPGQGRRPPDRGLGDRRAHRRRVERVRGVARRHPHRAGDPCGEPGQRRMGGHHASPAGGRPSARTPVGGRLISLKSMEGPALDVYGESVSNTEGWACRGAYFGAVAATNGRMQGLVAVQGDLRPTPRILAAPASGPHTTYRPLAWGPRDTVLLESWSTDEAGAPGAAGPRLGRHRGPALPGRRGRPSGLRCRPGVHGRLGALSGAQPGLGARRHGSVRVLDPLAPRPDVRDGVDADRVQRQGHLRRGDAAAAARADGGVAVHAGRGRTLPDAGGRAGRCRRRRAARSSAG